MQLHLDEIARTVAKGAHAGPAARSSRVAHDRSPRRPEQHHLDPPAFARPGAQPVENIWQYLRANWLFNSVFDTYQDIIDAACDAWQKLIAQAETITSSATCEWHSSVKHE